MKILATLLRDLYSLAEAKYEMNCLSGETSFDNLVSWVHMLEDPETATFLQGQELIFTTGIGYEHTDWLIEFAKSLVKNQASGLVINIGPYIKSVPKKLVEFCLEKKFPLFTIPWVTRIVDISNDFCRLIIKGEKTETTIAEAFRNLIFLDHNLENYRAILERKEFDLDACFTVVAISLQYNNEEKAKKYEEVLKFHLTKILVSYSDRFSIFKQDRFIIIVLQNFTSSVMQEIMIKLNSVCNYGENNITIHSGISKANNQIKDIHKNYKRAIQVVKLSENRNELVLAYDNIGIHQLLIEVEDINVLEEFYDAKLGYLEEYDQKNQTDYYKTIQCYLENNMSVQEVAKRTYVHRNTVNYKVKKIKEILDTDLNYKDCANLFLAMYIKEILE